MSILRTTYNYYVEQGKLAKERLKSNRKLYKTSKEFSLKRKIANDKKIIKLIHRMIILKHLTPSELYTLLELLEKDLDCTTYK